MFREVTTMNKFIQEYNKGTQLKNISCAAINEVTTCINRQMDKVGLFYKHVIFYKHVTVDTQTVDSCYVD